MWYIRPTYKRDTTIFNPFTREKGRNEKRKKEKYTCRFSI
jgi:hypothetical protein